jgi:molecular chaperone DnaK (HSP70)
MAVIGIDLGNKFVRVAVLSDGIVEHILDENGDAQTPRSVAYTGLHGGQGSGKFPLK